MPTKDELIGVAEAIAVPVDPHDTKAEIETKIETSGVELGENPQPAPVDDYPERPLNESLTPERIEELREAGIIDASGNILVPQALPGFDRDTPVT